MNTIKSKICLLCLWFVTASILTPLHAAAAVSSIRVEFSAYEAREGEATVVIGVLRSGAQDLPASVDYSTANITALAGLDYVQTAGQLTFAPGETLKLLPIPLLRDALKEPSETFRFSLANAVGSTLSTQKSATITLKDSNPGVSFSVPKYFIHEDEPVLHVTVRRGDNPVLAPGTVNFATLNGTAIAGQDYMATNGSLAFAAGELSRAFEVGIINDGMLEPDENFQIVLSDPTGGSILGTLTNLTVVLCDATGGAPHGYAGIHADADGMVKLTFSGGVSQRFQPYFDLYPVEVSTNLVDWQFLALLQRTNSAAGEFVFRDNGAKTAAARYYRVPPNHFTSAHPKPSGPYSVGKRVRVIHDSTRRNRHGISTNGSFAITVLYPAAPKAGQRPAPWFKEAFARDSSGTSYWATFDKLSWLDRLPYFSTYSFPDAPLVDLPGPMPVILYSPGYTVDRSEDINKLEVLASHGYLVVTLDHYDALNTEWPDGFYFSTVTVPGDTAEDLNGRVRDLAVALDELANWNEHDPEFAGRIAVDRVGGMGMSWGGITVAEFAQKDPRCLAVVQLDPGGNGGSVAGFSKPSLTMHSPDASEQSLFNASKTNAVWFQISNTDHGSFANEVVFSMPSLAANREAARTIQAYALSFFNKWLKGQDDTLHESKSPVFPRVVNFRKK